MLDGLFPNLFSRLASTSHEKLMARQLKSYGTILQKNNKRMKMFLGEIFITFMQFWGDSNPFLPPPRCLGDQTPEPHYWRSSTISPMD